MKPFKPSAEIGFSLSESLLDYADKEGYDESLRSIFHAIAVSDPRDPRLDEAKRKEMQGLMKEEAFGIVDQQDLLQIRVFLREDMRSQ